MPHYEDKLKQITREELIKQAKAYISGDEFKI